MLGGALLTALGIVAGVRTGIAIGIVLAIAAAFVQWAYYDRAPSTPLAVREALAGAGGLDPLLKRLLAADILVRFGQGIGEVFIVLFVLEVLNASPAAYGALIGLAMFTSILVYLPAARRADATVAGPCTIPSQPVRYGCNGHDAAQG